jgi:hypothetical protein
MELAASPVGDAICIENIARRCTAPQRAGRVPRDLTRRSATAYDGAVQANQAFYLPVWGGQ